MMIDNKQLLDFLKTVLNDESFSTLCYESFPAVYQEFTAGMLYSQKVRLLVEYVERQGDEALLLARLKADHAQKYAQAFETPTDLQRNLDSTTPQIESGEWLELVQESFEHMRNQTPLDGQHPLMSLPLLQMFAFDKPLQTTTEKWQALQLFLFWAVESSKPTGSPDYGKIAWRIYRLLVGNYVENIPISALAKEINFSQRTIKNLKNKAMPLMTEQIKEAIQQPEIIIDVALFWTKFVLKQYDERAQMVARRLALYDRPISLTHFHQIMAGLGIDDAPVMLETLRDGLVMIDEVEQTAVIHHRAQAYLRTLNTPAQQREWEQVAANYYYEQHQVLFAITHWYRAGGITKALHILLEQAQALLDRGIPALSIHDRFTLFEVEKLPVDNRWQFLVYQADCLYRLSRGNEARQMYQVALQQDGLSMAQQGYTQHQIAKLWEKKNHDEAVQYYEEAISNLRQTNITDTQNLDWLVSAYADYTIFHVQVTKNMPKAQQLYAYSNDLPLESASLQVQYDVEDRKMTYAYGLEDPKLALQHGLHAMRLARLIGNARQLTQAQCNLAQAYGYDGQPEKSLAYLQEAEALAKQTGDVERLIEVWRILGMAYFFAEDMEQAIIYYHKALELYESAEDNNGRLHIHGNLAEAYVKIGDVVQAQAHQEIALELYKSIPNAEVGRVLKENALHMAQLRFPNLSDRQQSVLEFLKSHAEITNTQYRKITGVSRETATRDLKDMVNKEVVEAHGDGAGRYYKLNISEE